MLNSKTITELAEKLNNALPDGFKKAHEDLRAVFRDVLQNQLAKLDIVTREEFDVQQKILQRTREKLEQLEKKLAEK
jgi:BMFP domain-containing protein YqiC